MSLLHRQDGIEFWNKQKRLSKREIGEFGKERKHAVRLENEENTSWCKQFESKERRQEEAYDLGFSLQCVMLL